MVIYSRFTRLDSPKTTNVSLSDTGKLQIIIQINYINIISKFCSIYLRPEVLCSKCVFLDFVFVYLASINHRVNYYYYDYCLIFSILDAVAFVASLIGKRLPFLGLTDSQRKQRAQGSGGMPFMYKSTIPKCIHPKTPLSNSHTTNQVRQQIIRDHLCSPDSTNIIQTAQC